MRCGVSSWAVILLSLLDPLLAGCGAREGLDAAGGGSSLQCEEIEVTDVPECARVSPEAVPLARIASLPGEEGGRSASLAADEDDLYFVSESRVFRVSKHGGAPQPLTPTHTAGGALMLVGELLYWSHEGWVKRMPVGGGAIESVVELPDRHWTVAPDAILSWEVSVDGAPLWSTSLSGGETTILWEGLPDQDIKDVRADAEHAYLAMQFDLYRVPLEGGAAEHLVGNGSSAKGDSVRVLGFDPLVTDEHVYFGANDPIPNTPGKHWPGFGVYRISKASPEKLERVTDGYPGRMVDRDSDLFMEVVMPANDGPETRGEIVRVPLDGGEVERIGESSARAVGGNVFIGVATGIAASDCSVYFHVACDDEEAHRLVALPYGDAANE